MREEGLPPPAVASDPALRRPLEAPAAKRCGLRVLPPPCGAGRAQSGRPAAAARQGDRGEGRLHSPVTSRQNNSRAVRGGQEANAANYVHLTLCEKRQERSGCEPRQAAKARPSLKWQTELGAIRSSLGKTMHWFATDGDKYVHRSLMGLEA